MNFKPTKKKQMNQTNLCRHFGLKLVRKEAMTRAWVASKIFPYICKQSNLNFFPVKSTE